MDKWSFSVEVRTPYPLFNKRNMFYVFKISDLKPPTHPHTYTPSPPPLSYKVLQSLLIATFPTLVNNTCMEFRPQSFTKDVSITEKSVMYRIRNPSCILETTLLS